MPRKKKETTFLSTKPEISVGLVKRFDCIDNSYKDTLNGHPAVGRLYRIIKDFDPSNNTTLYRIHIGRENNERQLDGLLLGFSLEGESEGRYSFSIEEVTKENFLDFNLQEEDISKLAGWFDTDHSDLKQLLGLTAVAVDDLTEELTIIPEVSEKKLMDITEFLSSTPETSQSLADFPTNFDKIFFKDVEFAKIMADYTEFVSSTYDDKYETPTRPNLSRNFLLGSSSPDVAVFNAMKYLQRYCTEGFEKSGNIRDLYKSIHYIMFELIRKERQNG